MSQDSSKQRETRGPDAFLHKGKWLVGKVATSDGLRFFTPDGSAEKIRLDSGNSNTVKIEKNELLRKFIIRQESDPGKFGNLSTVWSKNRIELVELVLQFAKPAAQKSKVKGFTSAEIREALGSLGIKTDEFESDFVLLKSSLESNPHIIADDNKYSYSIEPKKVLTLREKGLLLVTDKKLPKAKKEAYIAELQAQVRTEKASMRNGNILQEREINFFCWLLKLVPELDPNVDLSSLNYSDEDPEREVNRLVVKRLKEVPGSVSAKQAVGFLLKDEGFIQLLGLGKPNSDEAYSSWATWIKEICNDDRFASQGLDDLNTIEKVVADLKTSSSWNDNLFKSAIAVGLIVIARPTRKITETFLELRQKELLKNGPASKDEAKFLFNNFGPELESDLLGENFLPRVLNKIRDTEILLTSLKEYSKNNPLENFLSVLADKSVQQVIWQDPDGAAIKFVKDLIADLATPDVVLKSLPQFEKLLGISEFLGVLDFESIQKKISQKYPNMARGLFGDDLSAVVKQLQEQNASLHTSAEQDLTESEGQLTELQRRYTILEGEKDDAEVKYQNLASAYKTSVETEKDAAVKAVLVGMVSPIRFALRQLYSLDLANQSEYRVTNQFVERLSHAGMETIGREGMAMNYDPVIHEHKLEQDPERVLVIDPGFSWKNLSGDPTIIPAKVRAESAD